MSETCHHPRFYAEGVCPAIKRNPGEPLPSKNPTTWINDLLARLLAYRLGVVVSGLFWHRIDLGATGLQGMAPRTRTQPKLEPGTGVERDFVVEPVKGCPPESARA